MAALKIVIDTNVIVSALRSKRGASNKLLSLLGTDKFSFHLSVPLVLEYEEVLLRQLNALSYTQEEINGLIEALCALGVPQEIFFLWRPALRDPHDELVLELAVAAQANFIVTYNLKDFREATEFGIQVLTPKTFLQRIGEIK